MNKVETKPKAHVINENQNEKAGKSGKALKIILPIVIVLAVLAGAFLFISFGTCGSADSFNKDLCTNPYIPADKTVLVSAHRSGGGIAPEETMMAFKNCIENDKFNIDIFEFDLHLTKDNVLVLLHDDTLDRTSNSEEFFGKKDILASELTYEELRQLNMGEFFVTDDSARPFQGLRGDDIPDDIRIQRIEDVLDYLNSNGDFQYIIEIKDGGERGFKGVDLLYDILKERNLLDKVIFGTFKGEVSEYVDKNHSDLKRSAGIKEALSFYFHCLFNMELKQENINYVALQIPANDYGFHLGTTKLVNYAHKHNLAVQYWTINDAEVAKQLIEANADAIMSDYPDMIDKVVNENS